MLSVFPAVDKIIDGKDNMAGPEQCFSQSAIL